MWPRLIPGLAAIVIPRCCPTSQIRIAPATACLIRGRGATARTAVVMPRCGQGGRGKARLDFDMGTAHLLLQSLGARHGAGAAPAPRARVEQPAANHAEAAPHLTDFLRNHRRCARPNDRTRSRSTGPSSQKEPVTVISFEDLALVEPIRRALNEEGYAVPTPIQAQAIPQLLAGRDLLGIAQTGTGKTAAFALPILQRLAAEKPAATRRKTARVLVLTPTRELAAPDRAELPRLRPASRHARHRHLRRRRPAPAGRRAGARRRHPGRDPGPPARSDRAGARAARRRRDPGARRGRPHARHGLHP